MSGDELLLRALRWGIGRLGRQNLFTWSLMLVTVMILIQGLAENVRNLDTGLLWSIALPGLLLGWVISRWREKNLYTLVIALLAGWGVIVLRVGNLESLVLQSLYALTDLFVQAIRWKPGLPYPDTGQFLEFLAEFGRRAGILTERVIHWANLVMQRQTPNDPAAITASWCVAIWLVTFWTAWNFWRGRVIRGLIPATALLGAVLSFSGQNGFLLIPLFCVALVMSARYAFISQVSRWQKENIDYSEDLNFDLTLSVTLILSVLVVAMVLAPWFSYPRVIDFVREVSRSRQETRAPNSAGQQAKNNPGPPIGLALGLQQHPSPAPPSAISRLVSTGMPQEHLLGSGAELSHTVVMVVSVISQTVLNPTPEEARLSQATLAVQRPYWQAAAYDLYLGYGWATNSATQIRYSGGQAALTTAALPASGLLLEQHVQYVGDSFQPGGIIYAAGDLVNASQDYQVAWRNPPDNASENAPADIFTAASPAVDYQAVSYLPRATVDQLRKAGNQYPPWISQHYLQLPRTLPARVRSLAIELTATESTPYDQAHAIEQYLRTFPYTLQLPKPSSGVDLVDYFLFDLKKGYCDYDASAMVVLSRAAGLPARLVIGYATGTYDEAHQRFVVTEADAHSWPEIYFPGYGWVRFEPTGGRSGLDRPASTASSIEVPQVDLAQTVSPFPGNSYIKVILFTLASLVLLALAGLLVWNFSEPWRLVRLPAGAAVRRVYHQIHQYAHRLENRPLTGATPAEISRSLVDKIERLQAETQWVAYFNEARSDLEGLTAIYNQHIYSPHAVDRQGQQNTIHAWSALRRRLLLVQLACKLPIMRMLMRQLAKSGTISTHRSS
jgi:transglutaminase-like putative cysteine protease